MASRILRWLGALAGLGSAILLWFLGGVLSAPILHGRILQLSRARYELIAFLFLPALVLAVLALFWVPPQTDAADPNSRGGRQRLLLVLIFVGAFLMGFAR
jgi:hypothetical protein